MIKLLVDEFDGSIDAVIHDVRFIFAVSGVG